MQVWAAPMTIAIGVSWALRAISAAAATIVSLTFRRLVKNRFRSAIRLRSAAQLGADFRGLRLDGLRGY